MSHGQQNQPRLPDSEVSDVFVIVTCYCYAAAECCGEEEASAVSTITLSTLSTPSPVSPLYIVTSASGQVGPCQQRSSGGQLTGARPSYELRHTTPAGTRGGTPSTVIGGGGWSHVLLVQKYQYVFSTKCLLTSRYLCISHFNFIQTITS